MSISATVLADSICNGHRITTMKLQYPRFIHSEMCRHRMFSRNTASSRAIPIQKMIQAVKENPVMPIAWQKNHSGMQGTEYLTSRIGDLEDNWLRARDAAVERAEEFVARGTTKQIINRLLEPWMWCVEIVTATEWENFFHLRCPQYQIGQSPIFRSRKDCLEWFSDDPGYVDHLSQLEWLTSNKGQAEIHMMAIAEAMWDARNESKPRELQPGQWHIPYYTNEMWSKVADLDMSASSEQREKTLIKISTAMLAQVSYTVVGEDGKPVSYENLIDLHNSLLIRPYTNRKGIVFGVDDPIHASPAEHCARGMTEEEFNSYLCGDYGVDWNSHQVVSDGHGFCKNFRGWIPYRSMLPNENRR